MVTNELDEGVFVTCAVVWTIEDDGVVPCTVDGGDGGGGGSSLSDEGLGGTTTVVFGVVVGVAT